eukprot:7083130-Alexandrium_andersonii.AAC.1
MLKLHYVLPNMLNAGCEVNQHEHNGGAPVGEPVGHPINSIACVGISPLNNVDWREGPEVQAVVGDSHDPTTGALLQLS